MSNLIPRLITREPRILRGCTLQELVLLGTSGLLVGILTFSVLGFLAGHFLVMISLSPLFALIWLWGLSGSIQARKAQRPPYYYSQWITLAKVRIGLKTNHPFMLSHGYHDTRRKR